MHFVKTLSPWMLLVFCLDLSVHGEETVADVISGSGIGISGSLDFYSQYVWRGFLLDSDPVIQPGVGISFAGLTLSLWCSFDAAADDAAMSSEVDYAVDYTYETGKISLSIGNTYYTFPEYDLKSMEAYIGIEITTIGSPTLTAFYDYGDETAGGADGIYISLDISHSQPIYMDITLDVSTHVGYNHQAFISGDGYDIALSGGMTIPLFEGLMIKPSVTYSIPLADLKEETDGAQKAEIYFGASLGWEF
jgi:hypothetical protein